MSSFNCIAKSLREYLKSTPYLVELSKSSRTYTAGIISVFVTFRANHFFDLQIALNLILFLYVEAFWLATFMIFVCFFNSLWKVNIF